MDTPFEQEIRKVCNELADILISKNKKYGDSYRKSRIAAGETWNSRKVPLEFHATEKIRRYISPENDDEDSIIDLAGYAVLEAVCGRLDDESNR